jgi:hypothetical protein
MKKSDEPAPKLDLLDLEFPDWSGMDDSTARVTTEMAFRYCEQYPRWFPELTRRARAQRPPKCEVEFVL